MSKSKNKKKVKKKAKINILELALGLASEDPTPKDLCPHLSPIPYSPIRKFRQRGKTKLSSLTHQSALLP
jgi:hypothetical protein